MIDQSTARYGVLLLRVSLGVMFLAHAALKIFVFTIPGTVSYFASLGQPAIVAYAVLALEVLGGIGLILGVYVRWVAPVLALEILGTIVLVHGAKGKNRRLRLCLRSFGGSFAPSETDRRIRSLPPDCKSVPREACPGKRPLECRLFLFRLSAMRKPAMTVLGSTAVGLGSERWYGEWSYCTTLGAISSAQLPRILVARSRRQVSKLPD